MPIRFAKLSATGNDFILFDNREKFWRGDAERLFRTICTRRIAIGADGVLLIEPCAQCNAQSAPAFFTMRYFNRDGRESEMCGNGARASAYYAFRHGMAPAMMQFQVSGDLYHAAVIGNRVRLRMQKPWDLDLTPQALEEKRLEEGGYVNTGVPHYVLFAPDIEQVDVAGLGFKYRHHPKFQPAGTNVNFVAIDRDAHFNLRTYERGVEEETLACGTGTVASAVFAHLKKHMPFPMQVTTRGGELTVYGDAALEKLELEGEVRLVYYGEFEPNDFAEVLK